MINGRLVIIAAIIGAMLIMSKSTQARGIRNNNPGNIRHSADRWEGMRVNQTDPSFVQFETPEAGIRALGKIIINYGEKYGLYSVRQIISRWAPPSENNTEAYVFAVSSQLGVHPDAPLNFPADLPQLVEAIIRHENGSQPYSVNVVMNGIKSIYS